LKSGERLNMWKERTIAVRLSAGFAPRRPGFEPGVRSCGICVGQSGTGAGFLRVLRFPLPIIAQTGPQPSSSILHHPGWYNRPAVASVTVDSVPLQPPPKRNVFYHSTPNDNQNMDICSGFVYPTENS
jgi:hypothetical protein